MAQKTVLLTIEAVITYDSDKLDLRRDHIGNPCGFTSKDGGDVSPVVAFEAKDGAELKYTDTELEEVGLSIDNYGGISIEDDEDEE